MAYATLTQVKAAMSLGTADTTDDTQLTAALGAAEQMIDGYCDRSFGTAGTALESRVYAAEVYTLVYVDDCTSITAVETDTDADGTFTTSWTSSDWQSEPLNGRAGGLALPYDRVRAVGDYTFPIGNRAMVRVTGTWGWAAVPAAVTQATIQATIRLWKRLDTPLGYGGGDTTGLLYVSRQVDGDVAQLLAPYRKGVHAVGGIA